MCEPSCFDKPPNAVFLLSRLLFYLDLEAKPFGGFVVFEKVRLVGLVDKLARYPAPGRVGMSCASYLMLRMAA
jgi:hypothetical protein